MREPLLKSINPRSLLGDRAVWPGDKEYDSRRRVWNGMHDRRPALVARCSNAEEVSAILRWARSEGLAVSVRGGGHNVAGTAVADDAVVIDLALMNSVDVDPVSMVAVAGGGALLRDLDAATTMHGLACPAGVVSHTGLGGLTLGGGYGWLARKWGLTCDHLTAAAVVLPDGAIVEASPAEHQDLFWALRGGGGNFGVVTRFTLRLRNVGPVVHQSGVYALASADEALVAYAGFAGRQELDLHTVGALKIAGNHEWIPERLRGEPALFLTAGWFGSECDGADAIAPLFRSAPPDGRLDQVLSYAALQALGDHSEPAGHRYFTKSCYLGDISGAAATALVNAGRAITSPMSSIDFEFLRGAIAEVPDAGSAFPNRGAPYIVTASAQWTNADEDATHTRWSRQTIDSLGPWQYGGAYVNYVQDAGHQSAADLYGQRRYRRLAAAKARYDPENILRHNQNIPPVTTTS
ncbi:FAD-binding oxidoreductase [Amycolatopsis rubida]|uniref:FAD-binding oxidoreductase n=1 Tax=Amycolatopsis rubida TaxID=112413 RepID=A0ABX0BQ39_9PSEU|nr:MULTISPECIES: FAD-binding oxidoreductase [Amycolatopsis]MYW90730.1 FAD-binding protein [Amycolatopsis rubida]NEC55713.1 FAD-binding oxidoreductase [Amycolatopsis rubida]OAP19967.1 6-hydroxy-D-nicotine oxidase [Amycolatopsis sp. M39]